MSDVMVKCGTMQPICPMGQYYTRIQLNGLVDGRAEILDIDSESGKMLVIDGDGMRKGKIPNVIATGWLTTSGIIGHVAGTALLIDARKLDPAMLADRRRPTNLYEDNA